MIPNRKLIRRRFDRSWPDENNPTNNFLNGTFFISGAFVTVVYFFYDLNHGDLTLWSVGELVLAVFLGLTGFLLINKYYRQ